MECVQPKAKPTLPLVATTLGQPSTNYKAVIAIDFGTTKSGFAIVLRDSPTQVRCGAPGANNSRSEVKVPTVLFRNEENVWWFGNEAIAEYRKALDEDDDLLFAQESIESEVDFFQHFKLALKDQQSGTETLTAQSIQGHQHSLLDLISKSLKFLADAAISELQSGYGSCLNISVSDDIQWVITVPAIWNDFGKSFMRKAAVKAGIIDAESTDRLLLALEPESASIAVQMAVGGNEVFEEGSSCLVLDCGGGTVDITVHNVVTKEPLVVNELCPPSGGAWGGIYVDQQFELFLSTLFGETLIRRMKTTCPTELAATVDKFCEAKEAFDPNREDLSEVSLVELFSDDICEALELQELEVYLAAYNGQDGVIPFDLSDRLISKKVKKQCALAFTPQQMMQIFEPTLVKIVNEVSRIIDTNPSVTEIAIVGGYGSSQALINRIRSEFGHLTIVVPSGIVNPQHAVVYGAALYGLFTSVIGARKARYTFGVGGTIQWFNGCGYHQSEAVQDDTLHGLWVRDIFSPIVTKEMTISPLDTYRSYSDFTPLHPEQTWISFPIYKSSTYKPRKTQECERLGKLSVPCQGPDECFTVEFSFTTELVVEVVRDDGTRYRTSVEMD